VALPAWQILEMATINGAKALGWESRVGSLEVGKEADIVSVHFRNAPVYNVPAALVYVGTNVVTDVWVAGRPLLRDGKVLGVDERALTEKGNAWGRKIAGLKSEGHE
jgi:5-methylthioadenosine/S-adenosylhomocysteine deaminase